MAIEKVKLDIEGESFSYRTNKPPAPIEIGKKYRTRDGRDVRILCVDAPGIYPVRGYLLPSGLPVSSTHNGRAYGGQTLDEASDLIEVSPYSSIAIDAPGWWHMTGAQLWVAGHFAGVDEESGLPMMWINGMTSHTNPGNRQAWDEFTTTKPEGVA